MDKGIKISAKIVAIYALVGGGWVLFSDELLAHLVHDQSSATMVSLCKGWLFVAATATMLYLLIKRHTTLLIDSERKLQERNEELAETEEELRQQIEEYHKSQIELYETNQTLMTLFQASPLAIVALDPAGKVTQWNRAAELFFGWDAGEIIGQPYPLISPENQDAQRHFFENTLQGEVLNDIQVRRRKKSGEQLDVSLSTAPIMDAGGAICGIIVLITDITERKKAEEEIRKLNAELEQRVIERTAQLESANKELESFSYSVSHDLRAPLRHIEGFSKVLLEDYREKIDGEGKEYLFRLRHASQRMAQLIDDLLKLSKVTSSELNRQQVNLSRIAQVIALELEQTQPQRRVSVNIAADVMANGDARLLRVLMENLLANAWKYTGKQEESIIEFGTAEVAGETTYFIRDNGVGFDMAYADKLFGAFQRLHRSDEFEGTGVGLATVQRIINRHGGRIWAESAVGAGATFYFTLDGGGV